jgi:predicted nucleic acid-binding protein
VIFDTDVLIWHLRGNAQASRAVDEDDSRAISVVTFLELLQGARDKQEIRAIKRFLSNWQVRTVPLTENIGHRASIYMEEYGLAVAMDVADALIAATAVENREQLLTGNDRHFRAIKDLDLKAFKP